MGQGTRRFKRKFKKKPQTTDAEGQNGERRAYKDIVRDSEEFVNYYKSQKILPEEEWDTFMEYLRMDLPASFRITACSSAEAQRLLEIVKSDFFAKLLSSEDGTSKPDINNLPWYPNNMGWQLELTRKDIRRSEAYFRLHNFLMSETATGNISRQETVSMIPPLLLDVRPHHKVIDLCAAPGSKTAQLIETLHGDEAIPSGFVVANDVDNSRCYMLVHQAKRLNSPCCIITNHDASNMPNFLVQNEDGTEKVLKYDRVLCDVPCTGDGTLRKNADIWAKWNVGHANNLHGVQFRILKRGLELLEVGGRLVYSTCSLNPIENEAVVLKMLHKAGDSVELINASAELNGLKCRPGMNRWNPMTKEQETALEEAAVTGDNPKNYGLEKCIRIFPQDGNTGAFFVAVLVKKSPLPWEADLPNCGSPEKSKKPQHEKRRKIRGYREDPFVFFKGDEDIWESIKSFYAIEDLDPTCLLTRCMVGKKRNIYLTSPAVKKLVDYNQDKIKFINTGVKVFARCDNKRMRCEFRLAQEGLFRIQNKIHARRVKLPEKDLITLLENHDPHNPPSLTLLTEETQELCKDIDEGSCVLDHEGTLNVSVAGWRGGKTVRAYISKPDALHYLRLFGVDTSKYDVNKFKKDEGAVAVPDDGDSKGEDQIENDSADIENGDDQTTKKPKMETISSAD